MKYLPILQNIVKNESLSVNVLLKAKKYYEHRFSYFSIIVIKTYLAEVLK